MPSTAQIYHRVKMTVSSVASSGTGDVTLGSAVAGHTTWAARSVANTDGVVYLIEEGAKYELGVGTYNSTGPKIARTTILASSAGGAAETFTNAAIISSALNETAFVSTGTQTLDATRKSQALINLGLNIANQRLLGNVSGSAAAAGAITISQALDILSAARGSVAYRGASGWSALAPGAIGTLLQSGGATGDPSWGYINPVRPGGRLTAVSGTPVVTSTVVGGSTTVYYTPYNSNFVPVWDGTGFTARSFAEMSQTLSDNTKSPAAAVALSYYDFFIWDDAGTLRCTRGPVWTSTTARGTGAGTTELQRTNGVWVNKNSITNGPQAGYGTYVGTIATDAVPSVAWNFGGAASGGSPAFFYVWNMYNRVPVGTTVSDSDAPHTYTTQTWRPNANNVNLSVTIINGIVEETYDVSYSNLIRQVATNLTVSTGYIAVGFNSTSAPTGPWGQVAFPAVTSGASIGSSVTARLCIAGALGGNAFSGLEYGGANTSFGNTNVNALSFRGVM